MKKLSVIIGAFFALLAAQAQTTVFGEGKLTIKAVAKNAVRVQYTTTGESSILDQLPDWIYVKHDEVTATDLKTEIDPSHQTLSIKDKQGRNNKSSSHKRTTRSL